MTDAPPTYRTAVLWGVLSVFVLTGTLGAAGVVYAFTGLLGSGRWYIDFPILVVCAAVASLSMLFITGILYRVDRLRGVSQRRVGLFE